MRIQISQICLDGNPTSALPAPGRYEAIWSGWEINAQDLPGWTWHPDIGIRGSEKVVIVIHGASSYEIIGL